MLPEANLRNRAWVLGLLVLANEAGLRPLSKTHLHALVFLANTLAPLYADTGVESRVVRHQHGPFYPDAQWDIDRMVGQSLVQVSNVDYRETDGHWWLDANYEATAAGEAIFTRCRATPLLEKTFQFLLELITAFASLHTQSMDAAPLQDAIYRTPGQPDWAALVFEEGRDNYSAITANAFADLAGDEILLSPKERIHLYLDYLGKLADTAATNAAEVSA